MSVPDAEKHLWQSVLLLAIEDALTPPPENNNPRKVGEARARITQCQEARDYLTTPSDDLALACTHAGIDMVALIERMTVQIANAPPLPQLPPLRQGSREVVMIAFAGEELTVNQWAKRTGINQATIRERLKRGYSVADALTPVNLRGKPLAERFSSTERGGRLYASAL